MIERVYKTAKEAFSTQESVRNTEIHPPSTTSNESRSELEILQNIRRELFEEHEDASRVQCPFILDQKSAHSYPSPASWRVRCLNQVLDM